MLDRSIPYYNMILRCDAYQDTAIHLPPGFRFKPFADGDEKAWAALEHAVGDFDSPAEAERYFTKTYLSDRAELQKRCIFAANEQGEIAGSCIAWRDRRQTQTVASLHWLVVAPAYQGRGLGKALCQKTMRLFAALGEQPVYLHTQPWSYKALLLYVGLGFMLQTKDTFSQYENQYPQAMQTLKGLLPEPLYETLAAHSV